MSVHFNRAAAAGIFKEKLFREPSERQEKRRSATVAERRFQSIEFWFEAALRLPAPLANP